ncbi:MAG: hypothetical protein JWR27_571 [Aeromicrobium sp.]|nr:hypothetical protein [Aeromicrobium sp.]
MVDNRRVRTSRIAVAVALSTALAVAGCSSDSSDAGATDTAAVPKGFDVPDGVALTKGGTTLAVGTAGTVVYEGASNATSAVAVAVTRIRKGSIKDFRFFSLDAAAKASTPYYVRATVRNEGPAGLGGATLPIYAHDDANTNIPANPIVGSFEPCQPTKLPASFLPDATAKVCLVYLIPKGQKLESVVLRPGTTQDAISWKP